MIKIRWHGRGGQGVVTASRLVAEAALREGKNAQAFPAFGAERKGAPIKAFTKISDKPILSRSQIYDPDIVIVLDPTLLKVENISEGLKKDGVIIVNIDKNPEQLKSELKVNNKVGTLNATKIAIETLGVAITNTPLLGALAKTTGILGLDTIIDVTKERFRKDLAEKNINALKRAYEEVKVS
ncbi:MAG: pyruvate ferredoxin oxidoreductase subunit gamma [Candidatus Jordarchaeum sp.]|uniref:pyruvate ferredoxin oxidoreductase subunit gamma n=1 Tax=Candidatus Jordarchaeum sp. TaxID=2823881 RepID=UPI004049CCCE